MTFLLYQTDRQGDGASTYRRLQAVKLAGKNLIYAACKDSLGNTESPWTITDRDMLLAGGWDPDSHALVIDIAPRRPLVSLYEIRSISGYSYADWTPLMLTFDQLFGDAEAPSTVEALKREFDARHCPRLVVREFLYLQGGYAGGRWTWGGNTQTTAALLFDGPWSYFRRQATAAEPA